MQHAPLREPTASELQLNDTTSCSARGWSPRCARRTSSLLGESGAAVAARRVRAGVGSPSVEP